MTTALTEFIDAYVARYPKLQDPFDPEWRSPCEVAPPQLGENQQLQVPWRPLRRNDQLDIFAPLASALETDIHPDITAYYGSFYSGGLEAQSSEGPVSLLQLWNQSDTDRLIENLLGHAIAKSRAKAPYSVFFACTEIDSELFLSVENHTGHVILERPGYKPERTIAASLAEFIDDLTPAPPQRHPERIATTETP